MPSDPNLHSKSSGCHKERELQNSNLEYVWNQFYFTFPGATQPELTACFCDYHCTLGKVATSHFEVTDQLTDYQFFPTYICKYTK